MHDLNQAVVLGGGDDQPIAAREHGCGGTRVQVACENIIRGERSGAVAGEPADDLAVVARNPDLRSAVGGRGHRGAERVRDRAEARTGSERSPEVGEHHADVAGIPVSSGHVDETIAVEIGQRKAPRTAPDGEPVDAHRGLVCEPPDEHRLGIRLVEKDHVQGTVGVEIGDPHPQRLPADAGARRRPLGQHVHDHAYLAVGEQVGWIDEVRLPIAVEVGCIEIPARARRVDWRIGRVAARAGTHDLDAALGCGGPDVGVADHREHAVGERPREPRPGQHRHRGRVEGAPSLVREDRQV